MKWISQFIWRLIPHHHIYRTLATSNGVYYVRCNTCGRTRP